MLISEPIFEKDNSIHFKCEFRTIDEQLVDPISPAFKIEDQDGNTIITGTPTRKSTGVYYFYHNLADEGHYIVEFSGTIAGCPVKARKTFQIKETKIN